MSRGAAFSICLFLCGGVCAAQILHYSPAQMSEILERIQTAPDSDQQRADLLWNWFADAGCNGQYLSEQRYSSAEGPNVICRMRGEIEETIIIGAHYDHASSQKRPIDNWSAAALLPSIYRALRARKRHHTFIFVAFADNGSELAGSEFFVSQMTAHELSHVEAMINLDALGLSPTKIGSAHSDKALVQALVNMVYVLKLPASQIDLSAAPTDSQPFAARKIPQITIHSLTQINLLTGKATAFRPSNYYDTYRLLCGYMAYLDETQKTRARAG